MARTKVETYNETLATGDLSYPVNYANMVDKTGDYGLVETLAVQNIRAVKSSNRIIDGFYEYAIDGNGKIIEEAIIEMAEKQAFSKQPAFVVKEPSLCVKNFNNFETAQYVITTRRDDIRAVLKEGGASVDDFVSKLLDTLTEGEGFEDFKSMRKLVMDNFASGMVNYSSILGNKKPKTMKGVVYALRDMFNHVRCTNQDLQAQSDVAIMQSVPSEDIRIMLSPKVMNLIDVVELANIFNLSKEELFGKLVIVDVDDLDAEDKEAFENKVFVYDRKALGKATRVFDYSQDVYGNARCITSYLTTEKCYFLNPLFKACYLDVSSATTSALNDILEDNE